MRNHMRVFILFCLLLTPAWALAQAELEQMQSNLDEGLYAAAVQLGPSLVEQYPERAEAHYLYASALYLSGENLPLAREVLTTATDLGGADARYSRLDGLLKAREGDSVGAITSLQTAFETDPTYQVAMDWGRVAWESGNFEAALTAYEAAATTETGVAELWPYLNRGRILESLEDYAGAEAALKQAIQVYDAREVAPGELPSPGYVEAWFRLGEIYEAVGQLEKASSHYQAASALDANYAPALEALEALGRR